jgi:hypothetical protein
MILLSKEYNSLVNRKRKGTSIPVLGIPKITHHKLGISDKGLPVFFILCADSNEKLVDSDLELIRVEFNRVCELEEKNRKLQGIYAIISLKSDTLEIRNYFLDIVYLMLLNLPKKMKMKDLRIEIAKLMSLFSRLVEPPKKTVQGLWAELLVIEQASNPEYLVDSWHVNMNDRYDFNDGIDKIEVKSTLKDRRIHSFSLEQANPNSSSDLLLASVMMMESGIGKNVFDLLMLIELKLSREKSYKLRMSIADVLGHEFEKAQEVHFDYQYAKDNLSFFERKNLPNLGLETVPSEFTNIRFDCDLTKAKAMSRKATKSRLHNAAI